jgi:hypothetical protein
MEGRTHSSALNCREQKFFNWAISKIAMREERGPTPAPACPYPRIVKN